MTVLSWLLDSDPALRWQVLRDLSDAPPGQWARGACFPGEFRGDISQGQPWTSTLPTLTLLREFGIDPGSAGTARPTAGQCVHHSPRRSACS